MPKKWNPLYPLKNCTIERFFYLSMPSLILNYEEQKMQEVDVQTQESNCKTNPRSLEEKKRYCQLWEASGLSKKEFSKQNKFSAKTLNNWIKVFASDQAKVENHCRLLFL